MSCAEAKVVADARAITNNDFFIVYSFGLMAQSYV
jgi:hypothetical protein